MLKSTKNLIFSSIKAAGLDPNDFILSEDSTAKNPTYSIKYKKTSFEFILRNLASNYDENDYKYSTFSPGYKMKDLNPDWVSASKAISAFENWLKTHLKRFIAEEAEPDLWEEFIKGNKTLNIDTIDFDEQSNFIPSEKNQVKLAINELKLLIQKEFKTSAHEQKLVEARLDYLVEASERLNKFDWKSLAISVLMSIAITLTLDTEKGHQLFALFKKVFSVLPQLIHQ